MEFKNENDLNKSDFQDRDLCITIGNYLFNFNLLIGGDGTYLRASGFIQDSSLPLLGIDSDPSRNSDALCNVQIPLEKREIIVQKIFENLQN